jgi:arylsulfatase A-like enzyme
MWDLVTGRAEKLHDRVYTEFTGFASVRDPDWHYFQHIRGKNRGAGPCLYDLRKDPTQTENVIAQHPDRAAAMREDLAVRLGQELPEVEKPAKTA